MIMMGADRRAGQSLAAIIYHYCLVAPEAVYLVACNGFETQVSGVRCGDTEHYATMLVRDADARTLQTGGQD